MLYNCQIKIHHHSFILVADHFTACYRSLSQPDSALSCALQRSLQYERKLSSTQRGHKRPQKMELPRSALTSELNPLLIGLFSTFSSRYLVASIVYIHFSLEISGSCPSDHSGCLPRGFAKLNNSKISVLVQDYFGMTLQFFPE